MLSPLISENVRSTARRSAPWKSRLTGLPVNRRSCRGQRRAGADRLAAAGPAPGRRPERPGRDTPRSATTGGRPPAAGSSRPSAAIGIDGGRVRLARATARLGDVPAAARVEGGSTYGGACPSVVDGLVRRLVEVDDDRVAVGACAVARRAATASPERAGSATPASASTFSTATAAIGLFASPSTELVTAPAATLRKSTRIVSGSGASPRTARARSPR